LEPDIRGISCCFDRESQHMLEDFRQNGLSDTATTILSALKARGIAGTTSLELGCGVGGLTLRLLREGVTSARGIDLSPKVVDAARSLAAEEGFSGSVTFEVGDGATTPLGKADLVMLDAVICCYPDFPALIGNSSAAARLYYALSSGRQPNRNQTPPPGPPASSSPPQAGHGPLLHPSEETGRDPAGEERIQARLRNYHWLDLVRPRVRGSTGLTPVGSSLLPFALFSQ
jgi:SAM-dependent methyltransferase